jgi:CheY-like chemotaxis protein
MKPLHQSVHGNLAVLVIDDDTVNLMVIETVLRPQGWEVLTACAGSEAYAICDEEDTSPDIVLLDYNLEVGDSGEEVLAKLRQRFGDAVPIVMCRSAWAELRANCRRGLPPDRIHDCVASVVRDSLSCSAACACLLLLGSRWWRRDGVACVLGLPPAVPCPRTLLSSRPA